MTGKDNQRNPGPGSRGGLVSLTEDPPGHLGIGELEARLETACTGVDPCFGTFCWQFASDYGCPGDCGLLCRPFNGCSPYCHE